MLYSSPGTLDATRLIEACRMAGIYDFIQSLPNQFATMVGERGILLSGGQKQRIGIARALYSKSQVIIFDEATSALDDITQDEIINTLDSLSNHITQIIVAHRPSALSYCNRIISLN